MTDMDTWYVVKQAAGDCVIVPVAQLAHLAAQSANSLEEKWGPFTSQDEAIARRVGLIRSGKCKPV
jgi:hypothetical protein